MPVVISQVDSFVGYMSDVWLSGYPMFPVVSEPADVKEAEMLETIMDQHAMLAGYPRQLLMAFRRGVKYNFMPIEHCWEPLDGYNIVSDMLKPTERAKMQSSTKFVTKINSLDPYNFVWDNRVAPADVCYHGEWAGELKIVPRIPMKRFVNMYSQSGYLYNLGEINSIQQASTTGNFYYSELPTINSRTIKSRRVTDDFDWSKWLGALPEKQRKRTLQAGTYEVFKCYARIIPADFGMDVPHRNTPQIWKFYFVNGTKLLYAEKIYSAYDSLPILIGQPIEDGFEMQTSGIGESQIEIQEAVSTLLNIRFNAARRAVSDRALYDESLINPSDANTREPAPKIPVRLSGLNNKTLKDAYEQIPYDPHGTDTVIVDMRNMLEISDRLSGLNKPMQGQFQKGNKSVQEWSDTMNMADNRPRLPALTIEFQVMVPIKESIKLNIFQYGAQGLINGVYQNMNNGSNYNVKQEDIEKMRQKVLNFRLADGYTPKSKMASTEFIGRLLETVSQNQLLAAALGPMLPGMFVHLAQLGGVRGLDQYVPKQPATAPTGAQPNGASAPTPTT